MKRSTVSFARISRAVFSVGVAVLIGALAVPTAAAPVSINTPAGLNPGDRFRIAFVTGTTTADISSTDIASYNLFVNTAAGGATYNGSAVTFYAIGSTATVNAYDNIRSTTMNDPVYLAGGAPTLRGGSANDERSHHDRATGGGLDAVDFVEVVGELLGGLERQGHDLVAEVLRFFGEFTCRFSRCHRSRSFPFRNEAGGNAAGCVSWVVGRARQPRLDHVRGLASLENGEPTVIP